MFHFCSLVVSLILILNVLPFSLVLTYSASSSPTNYNYGDQKWQDFNPELFGGWVRLWRWGMIVVVLWGLLDFEFAMPNIGYSWRLVRWVRSVFGSSWGMFAVLCVALGTLGCGMSTGICGSWSLALCKGDMYRFHYHTFRVVWQMLATWSWPWMRIVSKMMWLHFLLLHIHSSLFCVWLLGQPWICLDRNVIQPCSANSICRGWFLHSWLLWCLSSNRRYNLEMWCGDAGGGLRCACCYCHVIAQGKELWLSCWGWCRLVCFDVLAVWQWVALHGKFGWNICVWPCGCHGPEVMGLCTGVLVLWLTCIARRSCNLWMVWCWPGFESYCTWYGCS